MNILFDPWLPLRYRNGDEKVQPLLHIVHDDVVDFALPRADFKGAAYQFLIGLLQTVFAPIDDEQWENYYQHPPSESTLFNAFSLVRHAFNLSGDGPLFMQDFETLTQQKCTSVSALLIEAPGEQGIKQNTDHFIKRDIGQAMSLEMAALALFTLQINAPSGGQGHRTGLRGGGPLTTLLLPDTDHCSLWQKIWLNVINQAYWSYDPPNFNDGSVFPWLAPTKDSTEKKDNAEKKPENDTQVNQEKKGINKTIQIFHDDVHPLAMYWAMPRRIRLIIDDTPSYCKISQTLPSASVSQYRSKNYGNNYYGDWAHPLTPYTWDSKKPHSDHLPIKGQPGGFQYKQWSILLFSNTDQGQHCASVVDHFYAIAPLLSCDVHPRLWVFGYDMDNMKARNWYSTMVPFFHLSSLNRIHVLDEVKRYQELTKKILNETKNNIKAAWSHYPKNIKDMTFIDFSFWKQSEANFFVLVEQIITHAHQNSTLSTEQVSHWLNALRTLCMALFDSYALSTIGPQRAMAKQIQARQKLKNWLYHHKVIKPFIPNSAA